VTDISQRHFINLNDIGKQIVLGVGDTLELRLFNPSSQKLYITNDSVIKQTGYFPMPRSPPPPNPADWGIDVAWTFQALAEGTSYISLDYPSDSPPPPKFSIVVVKPFTPPNTPRYQVTFTEDWLAPKVSWSIVLADIQSPVTTAGSIVFVGVPNGSYNYKLAASGASQGDQTGGGGFSVNGADNTIYVTIQR
jgi:hypothetical protein